MTKLLIENLLNFKYYYLINILTLIIGIALINYIGGDGFVVDLFIAIIILSPELLRISTITKNGYLRLFNKLPLNKIEIFTHKYIVSISGLLFVQLLLTALNFFVYFPDFIFERVSFMSSFVYAGILIDNNTNLFSNPIRKANQGWTVLSFTMFLGVFLIFTLLYNFLADKGHVYIPESFRPLNFLINFLLQAIIGYVIGRMELQFKSK